MLALELSHRMGRSDRRGSIAFTHRSPGDPDDLWVGLPEADATLGDEAVALARRALPEMDRLGAEGRSDALKTIADALVVQVEPLAMLIARETGKTIRDARAEVGRAARICGFFSGEALRNVGERFESTRPGAMVEVAYGPIGVVGAITPWNFPIAIPAWKIAPALAFGNTVVWKPSELASATGDALQRIMADAMPDGAVSAIYGRSAAGAALVGADIDALSFTGSEATGRRIRQAIGDRPVRLQQEMGGVNGLIVLADADIRHAAATAINGAFAAAGQRCTATSRIILEDSIAESFLEELAVQAQRLKIGDPRDPSTDIGPLASIAQHAHVSAQVGRVRDAGGEPWLSLQPQGFAAPYFGPMLFDRQTSGSILEREEIFGPVAGVFRAANPVEAIELLNASPYGLSAGVCTRSLHQAEVFKQRARAGMLMVNLPTAGIDYHAPFGGVGTSSFGPREQGRAARHFFTTTQCVYQATV